LPFLYRPCTHCDRSDEPPSPQPFRFNSPQGMCPDCDGLGTRSTFDPDLPIPDPSLSLFAGAVPLVGRLRGMGRGRHPITHRRIRTGTGCDGRASPMPIWT
jgi:excinuclease ABC subunit A